jgi:hypothetical protein
MGNIHIVATIAAAVNRLPNSRLFIISPAEFKSLLQDSNAYRHIHQLRRAFGWPADKRSSPEKAEQTFTSVHARTNISKMLPECYIAKLEANASRKS